MAITILGLLVSLIAGIYWHIELLALIGATWWAFWHLSWLLYIRAHPWQTLTYTSSYFLVGAAWSLAKWWFEETERVRTVRVRFQNQSLAIKKTWEAFIKDNKSEPEHYKSDMLRWIAFWPLSAIFTLLDDPVRRLCQHIYEELQGLYQRITDHVWR